MLRKLFLAPLIVGGFLLAAVASYGATENEVIIGLNVPLSGPYVLQGKDQINAYALAKREIERQGGILGKKIKFLIADSQSDPAVSVKNVQSFIDQGADMITGGSSSGVAVAVSKLCQEKQKLFMATLTYSNDTTGKDAHRYTFRETYNSWMAANALSRHLKKHFAGKKYFYITSDYTWGWTTRDSMMQFTGTQGAGDVLIPLGEPVDSPLYRSAVQRALNEKAEVLVLVLFGRDMMAGLRQCIELGAKQKMQIVVPNLEMHMALGAGQQPVSGILGAMPWYWEVPYKFNFEGGRRFVEAYRARYNKPPCNGGGTAYTDLMLYKAAVEKVHSFDPKRVIPALEGLSFVGLKDEETFRSWDHQAIQSVYVVRGKSAEEMRSMWDIFDVVESYSGEDLLPNRQENPVQLEPM